MFRFSCHFLKQQNLVKFIFEGIILSPTLPIEKNSFASSAQHGDLKSYFTNQINKKIRDQDTIVKGVEETVAKALAAKENEVAELRKYNQDLRKTHTSQLNLFEI